LRISLCIPAASPGFFRQALASALAAVAPQDEVIVSDDCQSDAVAQIVRELDPTGRVRYIANRPGLGFFGNFTRCVELAQGRYIKLLNHDDVLEPGAATRMADILDAHPDIALVFSRRQLIDADGAVRPDIPATRPLTVMDARFTAPVLAHHVLSTLTNVIGEPSTAMFRKADLVIEGDSLFRWYGRDYHCLADLSLWLRLLTRGDAWCFARPLSSYRIHGAQEQRKPEAARLCMTERFHIVRDAIRAGFLVDAGQRRAVLDALHNHLQGSARLKVPADIRRELLELDAQVDALADLRAGDIVELGAPPAAEPEPPLHATPAADPRAVHDAAVAHYRAGKHAAALGALQALVEQHPAEALFRATLGVVRFDTGQHEAGVADLRAALGLRPDARNWRNLAIMLRKLDRQGEAAEAAESALQLAPDDTESLRIAATARAQAGEFAAAVPLIERLLEQAPDDADIRFNHAFCLLGVGRWEEGWAAYQARHDPAMASQRSVPLPDLPIPRWGGEPLEGKTILVWPEQGFGDEIQFCRYARHLVDRGARVWLATRPELKPAMMTVPWLNRVMVIGDTFQRPEVDYWVPLFDLPGLFGTVPASVPADVPYMRADPVRVAAWRERLAVPAGTLRIGLNWAGNPGHANNHRRSLPAALLDALAGLPGIRFFSLQVASDAAEWPAALDPQPLGADIRDFADTAAILAQLDLLITVDSAPAHLAGAMDVPVWTLLPRRPDWRWLLDRPDTPWYPSMWLWRQPRAGDWQAVVDALQRALQRLVRGEDWSVERPEVIAEGPLLLQSMTLQPAAACNDVRIHQVERSLAAAAPDVRIESAVLTANLALGRDYANKVFVWQRPLLAWDAETRTRVSIIVERGYTLVCEFDDFPDRWPMLRQNGFAVFRAMHAVQTSTEAMADFIRPWNPHVRVFPNCVESCPDLPPPPPESPVRIFFGALNREHDWRPHIDDLNRIAAIYAERVFFEVVHDRKLFDALETTHKRFADTAPHAEFLERMAACHIAWLPLIDIPFNRMKSDLKFIEAASRGCVALASHVVYPATLVDDQTGLIYSDAESFNTQFRRLIDEPELRQRLRQAAWQYVREHRMQSQQAESRLRWYRGLVGQRELLEVERQERIRLLPAG